MKEEYKEHLIDAGGRRVPGQNEWKPYVQICWREGANERIKTWTESHFTLVFPTEQEAETEGHLFARKWIDDDKPALER